MPDIVNVPALNTPVTPAGKPDTVAPVAPPAIVYVISVTAVLIQFVWLLVAAADVNAIVASGFTVISPLVADAAQAPLAFTV